MLLSLFSLHTVDAQALFGADVVPVSEGAALFGTASADGRYVIYAEMVEPDAGYALLRRDMQTGEVVTLRPADGTLTDLHGAWLSPNEQTVLYLTDTGLEAIPFEGGTSTPIKEVPSTEECPYEVRFDPASRYAIFSSLPTCEGYPLRIVHVALDTFDGTVIADDLLNLTHLEIRDGDYVLFTANRVNDAHYFLAVLPHNAIAPTIIRPQTRDALPLKFATFAADGTVVYQPVTNTSVTNVYRLSLPDTTPRLLGTVEKSGQRYLVTPSHNSITYTVSGGYSPTYDYIRRFSFARGTETTIADITEGHVGLVAYPFGNNDLIFTVTHTECPYTCGDVTMLYHLPNGGTPVFLEYYSPDLPIIATSHYLILPREGAVSSYDYETRQFADLGMPWAQNSIFVPGTHRIYLTQGDSGLVSLDITGATPPLLLSDRLQEIHQVAGDDLLYFSSTDGRIYATGNPSPPVTFAPLAPLHAEGETITVTVSLKATPLHPIAVDYALTGGTATEGDDFTFTPGTLIFAPFERTKTFTVELVDDGVAEAVETAVFTLSNITGGSAGEQTTYTVRIADEVYEQRLPILQR